MKVRNGFIGSGILVLSLFLILDSQIHLKVTLDETDELSTYSSNRMLRLFVLSGSSGYQGFVSSILWTQCIFSYADQLILGKLDKELAGTLRLVVDGDPLWKYPHEFAGLILEDSKGRPTPEGLEILRLGVERFPKDGKMAILLAQSILNSNWMDSVARYDSARKVLLPLMSPDVEAPDYARTLAITMASKVYGKKESLRQLIYVWGTTNDPLISYSFSKKLPSAVNGALGFRGDSLKTVCATVELIVRSKDQEAIRELIRLMNALDEKSSRSIAFSSMAQIANFSRLQQ